MRKSQMGLGLGLLALTSTGLLFYSCRSPTSSSVKEAVADTPEFSGIQLTLMGDEATGKVSAQFAFDNDEFKPGDKVELRYDVVRTPVEVKINCSSLRGRATVTLEGEGKSGNFTKAVDKALFASPVRDDPTSSAKLDMTAMLNSGGPLRVEGCFVRPGQGGKDQVLASARGKANRTGLGLADEESALMQYAKICAERLGPIPAYSCLDESIFKVLPTTQTENGVTTSPDHDVPTCDSPIYLPTGKGFCKPWARIGRLKTGPDSEAALVCRRYWSPQYPAIEGPNDPVFNDVAIIQHNRKTGETCWFQALGVRYGARVPPPSEAAVPEDVKAREPKAQDAGDFWLKPQEVAGINCLTCHDADPWMHSPYARQPKDEGGEVWLPSSPRSKYIMLGGKFGFSNWPQTYSVTPTENGDCVSCHRIGSVSGCENWARDAGGESTTYPAFTAKNDFAKAFPRDHWMPTADFDTYDTVDAWKAGIGEGHKAIIDCCNVKRVNGTRILGMSGIFGAAKPRYGKVMKPADQALLEAAGCKIKPISEIKETF